MEDKYKLVSIIMPNYNGELYLKECLDSLVKQTYHSFEIIVVDDGSTDESIDIIQSFAQKYDCIKLFKQANAGAGAARNLGLIKSKGQYICFVDSDDFVEQDFVEYLVYLIELNKSDIAMIQSINYNFDGSKTTSFYEYSGIHHYNSKEIVNDYIPLLIASKQEYNAPERYQFAMWCRIFKRELILENNIKFQNLKNGQDAIFTLEATLNAKKITVSSSVKYHYRNNLKSSLSKQYTNDRYYRLQQLTELQIDLIKQYNKFTDEVALRFQFAKRRDVITVLRYIIVNGKFDSLVEEEKAISDLIHDINVQKAYANLSVKGWPVQVKVLYLLIKHKQTKLLRRLLKLKFKVKEAN